MLSGSLVVFCFGCGSQLWSENSSPLDNRLCGLFTSFLFSGATVLHCLLSTTCKEVPCALFQVLYSNSLRNFFFCTSYTILLESWCQKISFELHCNLCTQMRVICRHGFIFPELFLMSFQIKPSSRCISLSNFFL